MLFGIAIGILLAGSIAVSTRAPSDETLKRAFDRGQRFYVIEDYEQAVKKFKIVTQLEDSRLVDEDQVLIHVGELNFPVKVAATFQLANSYSNLAGNALDEAGRSRDPGEAGEQRRQAQEYFRLAARYYKEAAESTELIEIQVLSQYQLVKTHFRAEDYDQVILEAKNLIARYPQSDYVDEAFYEMGWAHFNRREFPAAIAAFEQLEGRNAADYRIDRAQFQIGKSYAEQGEYEKARRALNKLVGKYDFSHLTEAERVRMETQKLSGVVKETAFELVAKAHILLGDTYAAEGRVEEATAAYRRVIVEHAQERDLVEDAYVKIGEAHFDQDDQEGGIQFYRRAIDEVSDRGFRARMQARIARQYYETRHFEQALDEYNSYISAYGDVARQGNLGLDRARFQTAQCYFELAEERRAAGDAEEASDDYDQARLLYEQVLEDYPSTALAAESLFGAGLAAQRRGGKEDVDEALKLFKQVRSKFGNRSGMVARARLQMARIYYGRQEYNKAIDEYRAYLEKYPHQGDRAQILLELGLAYRDGGHDEEAVETLDEIPPDSPVWAKAGLLAGELLLRLGRLDEAEAALQHGLQAASAQQAPGEFYYVLGRVYFEQKRYDDSLGAFATARQKSDKKAILQGSLLGAGTAAFKMKRYEAAVQSLEALLSAGPSLNIKDQAHRMLGRAYVQMGRRSEAIEDYEAIIAAAADPREKAEFTLLLAELYYSLERYEDSIARTREIIDADFKDTAKERGYLLKERAYFVMGDSYTRLERHEEAQRTFAAALKRYPHSPLRADLLFGQAVSAFALEENEQAASLLEDFITHYQDSPNLENGYYFMAYAQLRQTHFEAAADWFGRLVERYPQSEVAAEALFQRGENLFNLSHYEEAAAAYGRVLDEHPQSEFADNCIYNLGWCYFELERQEEAVAQFEELLERFPRSSFAPSAQFTLGDYYFNQKQYPQATAAYEKVVENYPRSKMATEARELLEELREIQAYLDYEEAMRIFDGEDYARASVALQKVVDNYSNTETRAGAMANLGMSYEFLRKWKDAARIYEELVKTYGEEPESTAAVAFAREHLNWIVSNRL